MPLKLKFMGLGRNPRLEPLREGSVRPKNIDLEFAEPSSGLSLFQHNLRYDDLEVSEMSLSESLIAHERRESFGNGRWDWGYIPCFLGRGFNWDRICVLPDSSIRSAADLKGKRLAVGDYSMTSLLCFRALLKDLYGIEASDIAWYNLRSRGLETGLDKEPPRGIELHWLPSDADPLGMLEQREVDAVHGVPAAALQSGRVRALFPAGARELASEHFRRARTHHINHHYVVQNRILAEQPWVAKSLYDAFEESRRVAMERAKTYSAAYLYFDGADFKVQDELFGDDPYPSGIAANRPTLERLFLASYEQGLITTPVSIEDFYAPETLST